MTRRWRSSRTQIGNAGFTMVEMLIVAAMVGILAGLAIQHYALLQTNAHDSTAASDARNISPAAAMASSDGVDELVILDGSGGPIPVLPGANASPGTVGTIDVGPNGYTIEVEQPAGNLHYRLDSRDGWSVTGG